ncbi:hypothetical protein GWJ21_07720 [Bacillus coagulans]|uniref:hypothetical protein n=1 Tax=Heyndrickxia coagulans TaxID=1398 RepID=UPI001377ABEF|nr:hypothetical protein [Heyndrickxia coagulans]NCG67841.1 hypothetical protein [Heyndrickxia coagulans]
MKRGILCLLTAVLLIVLAFPSSSLALSGNEPTYTYWMQSGDPPKYINSTFAV